MIGNGPLTSEAIDDYLKAIYELAEVEPAKTNELAQELGVTAASVSGMLRKLAASAPPWVSYEKHRGVRLSPRGRARALELLRRHRLVEKFLHDVLGYSWDEVHEEAEHLEHAISDKFVERLSAMLGNPAYDPHGHPIPDANGEIKSQSQLRLADLSTGDEAAIEWVSDDDAELLRYLKERQLTPGVCIRVEERAPLEGPMTLGVKGITTVHSVSFRVAHDVYVKRLEGDDG